MLEQAIGEGLTTLDKVKASARRVLTAKYALGLFESPFADPGETRSTFRTTTFSHPSINRILLRLGWDLMTQPLPSRHSTLQPTVLWRCVRRRKG